MLQEYIKTEANKMNKGQGMMKDKQKQDNIQNLVVPTSASNVVSWRTDGIKH